VLFELGMALDHALVIDNELLLRTVEISFPAALL